MEDIVQETQRAIDQVSLLGILDTMKYLIAGRRVNKAVTSIAEILNIRPLLTLRNGDVVRDGLVRRSSDWINRFYEFVSSKPAIQGLAIAHSVAPDQAIQLKARLGYIYPEEKIYVAPLSAVLGVHSGPGAIILSLRRKEQVG